MRRILLPSVRPVLLVAFALLLASPPHQLCAQGSTAARRIDSVAMLGHAQVLSHDSLEGRRAGTSGGEKARAYVVREFERIGLERVGSSYELPFRMTPGRDSATGEVANVAGVVRGSVYPDRFIVMTAHFDHLGVRNGEVFNGADDNASGTGALLALAAYFRSNQPRTSILFLAADAEERGLQGARAFVANPPIPLDSIVLNINMDMVGRNDRDELYATGTLHYPYLKSYIERAQPGARVKLLMGHDEAPPGGPASDNWTNASDHGAFHALRIPFLYFGVEDHPDYHRATDEFERLQPGFYVRGVETILDVVLLLDREHEVVLRRGRTESLQGGPQQ